MLKDKKDELIKGFYGLFNSNPNGKDNSIDSFQKKGSEIKSGVDTLLTQIRKYKAEALDKMSEVQNDLNYVPNKECEEYDEYKGFIDYIPKKFPYELIYYGNKVMDNSKGIEQEVVDFPSKDQQEKMKIYNEAVYKYLEMCVVALKLESLKRNIQEGKSYSLTINQLTILGL